MKTQRRNGDRTTSIRLLLVRMTDSNHLAKRDKTEADAINIKPAATGTLFPVHRMTKDENTKARSAETDKLASKTDLQGNLLPKQSPKGLRAAAKKMNVAFRPANDDSLDTQAQLMRRSQQVVQRNISWDEWYQAFARLCDPVLAETVAKNGNPAGSNRIKITVSRSHHITVKLEKSQNQDFDNATLNAYRSVDGNALLEFPQGSKRDKVSFFIDNDHPTTDAVSGIDSTTLKGDAEPR